jgi:hypothetical protein
VHYTKEMTMSLIALLALAGVLGAPPAAAAADETETPGANARRLWDESFKKSRRESAPRPAKPRATPTVAPRPGDAGEAFIGVTLWRLRPAATRDRDKGLVLFRSDTEELVAERVDAGAALAVGDKVRVGIESARPGYLYLLNRERYADGSAGRPYLISPTLRLHKGENAVGAGRLVEVPGFTDQPPFFVIKPTREDQVAEELIVLVTDAPLPDLTIGPKALALSEATVAEWEKAASAQVTVHRATDTVGAGYAAAEHEASEPGARLLTHEDPLPQTLYRVVARPGQPVMIRVLLTFPR